MYQDLDMSATEGLFILITLLTILLGIWFAKGE